MDNPLSNLQIDTWYKGIIIIAAAALIVLLTVDKPAIALVALGFLLIGIGEWINHPTRYAYRSPTFTEPGMMIESTARQPTLFGWIVDAIGLGLIGLGAYRLD
jgi:hypothetical protein